MMPKRPASEKDDLAPSWYAPSAATHCRAIVESPPTAYVNTKVGNTTAIVSDDCRVLGLVKIGPEAGLPEEQRKASL